MSIMRAFENEQDDIVMLPEEIFIVEPATEVDMSAEIITLEQMDQSISELLDVASDMGDAGGMSQRFALEAERILPGIMGRPVNFHTQAPSATHYRVSLEEVHKGIWALAAAAAVAVVAAIYKIYKWLSGDSSSSPEGGSKAGAAAKVAETKKEAEHIVENGPHLVVTMKEVTHTLQSNPIEFTDKKGKAQVYRNMEQVIDSIFISDSHYGQEKSLLHNPDPISYDIIYAGEYTKLIEELAKDKVFYEARQQIRDKLKVVEELIHDDRNSQGNQVLGVEQRMKALSEPIRLAVKGGKKTLREIHSTLTATRDKVRAKKSPNRLHYDDCFKRMEVALKKKDLVQLLGEVEQFLPVVEEMREKIKLMEGWIGELSQDGQPGGNTPAIAQSVRMVLHDMMQQVTGFAGMLNEINHYVNDNKRLVHITVGFGREIVRKMTEIMPENDVPKEWKTIRAQIQGAHKAMQEAHYPSGYKDPTAGHR